MPGQRVNTICNACRQGPGGQDGVALLEALVAMAVVALALMALLHAQWRSLADADASLRRTQAVHLIDDLAERIRANPGGAAVLPQFLGGWQSGSAEAAGSCEANSCAPGALAAWDLAQWRQRVARALPRGDAAVLLASPEASTSADSPPALVIVVGWRPSTRVLAGTGPDAKDAADAPLQGSACPAGLLCHSAHVQP